MKTKYITSLVRLTPKWGVMLFLLSPLKAEVVSTGPNPGMFLICSNPPIFVSSATAKSAGSVTTSNVSIANVQAGDELAVSVICNLNNASAIRVTDNATIGSTYTARTKVVNTAGPTTVQVFTATANASGTLTITYTLPAAADAGVHVASFRNIKLPPNDFDTQASGTEAGSGTTFNTGSFSTAQANNAILLSFGNESTSVTNIALTTTAGTVTKINDLLTNTSSTGYTITNSVQSSKTATATWSTASSDGVLIATVLRGACGI